MKAIYQFLFLFSAVFCLIDVAIGNRVLFRTVSEEEALSKARLERDIQQTNFNKLRIARWKDATNMTDENDKEYQKVELEVANWLEVNLNF